MSKDIGHWGQFTATLQCLLPIRSETLVTACDLMSMQWYTALHFGFYPPTVSYDSNKFCISIKLKGLHCHHSFGTGATVVVRVCSSPLSSWESLAIYDWKRGKRESFLTTTFIQVTVTSGLLLKMMQVKSPLLINNEKTGTKLGRTCPCIYNLFENQDPITSSPHHHMSNVCLATPRQCFTSCLPLGRKSLKADQKQKR